MGFGFVYSPKVRCWCLESLAYAGLIFLFSVNLLESLGVLPFGFGFLAWKWRPEKPEALFLYNNALLHKYCTPWKPGLTVFLDGISDGSRSSSKETPGSSTCPNIGRFSQTATLGKFEVHKTYH